MVTYGDYFSRKVLHNCAVSPDKTLLNNDETAYLGSQRTENIRSKMSEIYQTLYSGYTEKNTSTQKESFDDFQIERKIVSAFYDSGVLTNAERDYFHTQSLNDLLEREQISVEEANPLTNDLKAQKVENVQKMPLTREVLK